MTPRVTVVVPTYRRPDLLVETLRSVLGQTLGAFEVVVTDDGPGDETARAVAALGDARLRYRQNATNLGQARNVRAGLLAARAPLVSLLHDDDLLAPTALERLVEALDAHPEAALAFGDHWIADAEARPRPGETEATSARYGRDRLAPGPHRPFRRLALVDLGIHFGLGTTYRRAALALDDYPAEVGDYCDRWLGYLACRDGDGAVYVDERTALYRKHGAQVSGGRGLAHARAGLFVHRRFLADDRLAALHGDLAAMAAHHELNLGLELLWAGRPDEARAHLLRGRRARPLRAAAALGLSALPAATAPALRRALGR